LSILTSLRARPRLLSALPVIIFAVNLWVVWKLFFIEYLNQLPSVEGEFIAMARYIQRHWPTYDWQSLWNAGFPAARTYQPLVHYSVAAFSSLSGLSPASGFHFIGALSYSLGGVAFYYLAKALSGSRAMAFGGALSFSLFSPSGILIPVIARDAGGIWNARRLQALVVYGELPNLTGLMIGMFALALLHRAVTRRTPGSALLAALVLAAVPATNWPSTVALAIAILCYVAALRWTEMRDCLLRVAAIGLMATAFALPFALPSTVFSTFADANLMAVSPVHDVRRWLGAALLVSFFLIRLVLIRTRTPFGIRFAALWLNVLGWIVLSSSLAGVDILPLAMRFHIALEIPLTLMGAFLVSWFGGWCPRNRRLVAVVFTLFVCAQIYHYHRYARSIIQKLDIAKTLEYEEAQWFDANMHGERVLAPGTVQFWMNAFTNTPQMTGCCLQSLLNRENLIAAYVTSAGYQSDAESADYATLWMKAYAVHAVAIGGPQSREWYKDFKFPDRFRDRLPLAWSSGDDFIYRVPERVSGLARIVRKGDLVSHPPVNGIDVGEMRPFVAALDDSSLPVASWQWHDTNTATIRATLTPEEVIAVALNYHKGWQASVAGKKVPVRADGLGFVVIQPGCSGPCEVEMHWSPGIEPWIVVPLALLTFVLSLAWSVRSRYD
jgi:hypothetical protein